MLTELVVAAPVPLPIDVPVPEPEPQHAVVLMEHAWGVPLPVDNGGQTFAHHQKCLSCNAVAQRFKGRRAGKGVTVLLPGMQQACPGY